MRTNYFERLHRVGSADRDNYMGEVKHLGPEFEVSFDVHPDYFERIQFVQGDQEKWGPPKPYQMTVPIFRGQALAEDGDCCANDWALGRVPAVFAVLYQAPYPENEVYKHLSGWYLEFAMPFTPDPYYEKQEYYNLFRSRIPTHNIDQNAQNIHRKLIPFNAWSTVTMRQEKLFGDQYFFTIEVNQEHFVRFPIGEPRIYENVKFYAGGACVCDAEECAKATQAGKSCGRTIRPRRQLRA